MHEVQLREATNDAADWTRTGLIAVASCAALSGVLVLVGLAMPLAGVAASEAGALPEGLSGPHLLLWVLQWLGSIATGVAWVVWSLRLRRALATRVPVDGLPGAGALVGFWFVPVWNLVGPYQSIQRLWDAAAPASEAPDGEASRLEFLSGPFRAWWSLWVVSSVLGFFTGRLMWRSDDPEVAVVALGFTVLASGLRAAAGFTAVAVVSRLTRRVLHRLQGPVVVAGAGEYAAP